MFLVLVTLLVISSAVGNYIGAVVEHTTFVGNGSQTSDSLLSVNIGLYENHISLASSHKVQVIVFPEFGLTPTDASERSNLYPFAESIPAVGSTPCGNSLYNDRPILSRLSCSAKTNNILVLINMVDWVSCSGSTDSLCPSDAHYQYNTDVLFNEQGTIVAKYHKSHEFPSFKPVYDEPLEPSQVSYKSSFDVTFGLFICYDIMFENPAKVLRAQGIQHFLYAVAQGSLGESTIIEPWSKNNDAVVLSANLGSGRQDCSGLIVKGKALGATKYFLNRSDFPNENILVAEVPV